MSCLSPTRRDESDDVAAGGERGGGTLRTWVPALAVRISLAASQRPVSAAIYYSSSMSVRIVYRLTVEKGGWYLQRESTLSKFGVPIFRALRAVETGAIRLADASRLFDRREDLGDALCIQWPGTQSPQIGLQLYIPAVAKVQCWDLSRAVL